MSTITTFIQCRIGGPKDSVHHLMVVFSMCLASAEHSPKIYFEIILYLKKGIKVNAIVQ